MTTPDLTIEAGSKFLFARRQGQVVGLLPFAIEPGGVGLLFPVQESDPGQIDVAGALIRDALQRFEDQGCAFAQLVLDTSQHALAAPFEAEGFRHLTDAWRMERDLRSDLPPVDPRLTATPCDPVADADALALLLGEISQGSRDCLGLNERRSFRTIIDGHAGVSAGGAAWWIFEIAGTQVGAAFCSVLPDQEAAELLFFGVRPEFRGQGLGAALLRSILSQIAPRTTRINAAVDSSNTVAVNCYDACGFIRTGLSCVWIHSLVRAV